MDLKICLICLFIVVALKLVSPCEVTGAVSSFPNETFNHVDIMRAVNEKVVGFVLQFASRVTS